MKKSAQRETFQLERVWRAMSWRGERNISFRTLKEHTYSRRSCFWGRSSASGHLGVDWDRW